MCEDTRGNLAASLHSTAVDLSEVAGGLAGLNTDDEIERQARILERIAEDASDGATILRGLMARRGPSPLPRRMLHRPQ